MKQSTRADSTGEVFTPRSLIREMLDALPSVVWFDPNKTWLEPAAGDGNFLVEIKARLLQAGHDEQHVLDNMLFSVELMDDNHWVLQHRLGYLVDGQPNPKFWPNGENFQISPIHPVTVQFTTHAPYDKIGLSGEVLHHRNHVCGTALEYDMSFGRGDEEPPALSLLEVRDLGEWPETDTPDIGEPYKVEQMLADQPISKKEPKHKKVAEVNIVWLNREEIPKKVEGKSHVYALLVDDQVWVVGESSDTIDRVQTGYKWKIETGLPDTAVTVQTLQCEAQARDGKLTLQVLFLEQCERSERLERESFWIDHFRAEGHPLVNASRPVKTKAQKAITAKIEKATKPKKEKIAGSGKSGGWQVKASLYGRGTRIRCNTPVDGSFWECDHDALVDAINASLKAKGKPLLGEPGPSEKSYGASSGLREPQLWSRVS